MLVEVDQSLSSANKIFLERVPTRSVCHRYSVNSSSGRCGRRPGSMVSLADRSSHFRNVTLRGRPCNILPGARAANGDDAGSEDVHRPVRRWHKCRVDALRGLVCQTFGDNRRSWHGPPCNDVRGSRFSVSPSIGGADRFQWLARVAHRGLRRSTVGAHRVAHLGEPSQRGPKTDVLARACDRSRGGATEESRSDPDSRGRRRLVPKRPPIYGTRTPPACSRFRDLVRRTRRSAAGAVRNLSGPRAIVLLLTGSYVVARDRREIAQRLPPRGNGRSAIPATSWSRRFSPVATTASMFRILFNILGPRRSAIPDKG